MTRLFFTTLSIVYFHCLYAQSEQFSFSDEPLLVLKSTVSTNQNSITWNTHNLIYHVSGIDSVQTSIESFDSNGENTEVQFFPFFTKGVWYNSSLDFLEAYDFLNNSCVSFFLDDEGAFENQDTLTRLTALQEEETSAFTVYNTAKDVYAYLEPIAAIIIEVGAHTGEIENYISLNLPVDKKNLEMNQLLYTDITQSPYLLVNTKDSLLYFVDQEGNIVQQIPWPKINFSPQYFGFANGLFWMYDSELFAWNGFSID